MQYRATFGSCINTQNRVTLGHYIRTEKRIRLECYIRRQNWAAKGVINVVRGCDCSSRGICQNLQFGSSLLNTIAPANCARVSSAVGREWVSLSTLSFSGRKSTQILMSPDFFGITTIWCTSLWVCSLWWWLPITPFYVTPSALSFEEVKAHYEEQTERMAWSWVSILLSIPHQMFLDL